MKPPPTPSATRKPKLKAARRNHRPSVQVIEEATNLLSNLPLTAWVLFYATSLPFILGMLFFWSDISGSPDAERRLVPLGLGLGLLYVLMKCGHAVFADRMLRRLHNDSHPPEKIGFIRWMNLAASQGLIHATMPWLMGIASFAVFPTAWVYAFYRNTTIFACGHLRQKRSFSELVGKSMRAAHHAPRSNHGVLMTLFLVALMIWLNAIILMFFIPQLTGIMTGIELQMNRSPMAMFNTTMLTASIGATWLIISPVFQAAYVVRCFESDSVKSGEDLVAGLRQLKIGKAVPALVIGFLCLGSNLHAADTAPAPERVVQLDDAIDTTLDDAVFRWRMPREAKSESEMGWLERTMNDFADSISGTVQKVADWVGDFVRWMLDREDEKDVTSQSKDGSFMGDAANARILLVILIVVLVLVLVFLLARWLASRRAVPKVEVQAAPEIDLSDEMVIASDLPEDEWLRLANEKLAEGDLRLALRALFLGILSRLGAQDLLLIAPGKTNGMYQRELARRSRSTEAVCSSFNQSVHLFEHCWYGSHVPSEQVLEEVRSHHQAITRNPSNEPQV